MAYGVRKMQGTDINPVAQEIFAKAGGKPMTLRRSWPPPTS